MEGKSSLQYGTIITCENERDIERLHALSQQRLMQPEELLSPCQSAGREGVLPVSTLGEPWQTQPVYRPAAGDKE